MTFSLRWSGDGAAELDGFVLVIIMNYTSDVEQGEKFG